jgi:hypothetical protein
LVRIQAIGIAGGSKRGSKRQKQVLVRCEGKLQTSPYITVLACDTSTRARQLSSAFAGLCIVGANANMAFCDARGVVGMRTALRLKLSCFTSLSVPADAVS